MDADVLMLCGPEHFFQRARGIILPWRDDDDDDRHHQSRGLLRGSREKIGTSADSPAIWERSPHDPLPEGWMTIPQQYGITICVKEPSLTVGKILRHCQDCD